MSSPAATFKTAQEAALRASSALQTAMGGTVRVYTEVPANAPLPYVLIGQDEIGTEDHGCAGIGEIVSTVQWWSKVSPLDKGAQARAMGSAILTALRTNLSLTGWTVDEWTSEPEFYATDPDQSTRGRIVFRYLVTEIVA